MSSGAMRGSGRWDLPYSYGRQPQIQKYHHRDIFRPPVGDALCISSAIRQYQTQLT